MSKFKVGDIIEFHADGGGFKKGYRCPVLSVKEDCVEIPLPAGGSESFYYASIERLSSVISSPHYTPDASGKDYLARCEETYSRDEMIGAYRFTIGKYVDRMGKKQGEPVEKELDKIIDYATRAKQWLGRQ